MPLSNIEKHYNKHPEDLRLLRRHGMVEFETTLYHLHRFLKPGMFILDIGAGTGRYTSALMAEGYQVKAVELVKRNIDVFLKREPTADVMQGDARDLSFLADGIADVTLLLGPLYHLMGDEEKLRALNEAKRVTKPEGLIFVAYLMNEYSILSYCFDDERIVNLLHEGVVDQDYHIRVQEGELYDYVRLEDIDRLNHIAQLERVSIFSPDGASDYMRTRLNHMSLETFSRFLDYQKHISERQDLIGAGSHVVDVLKCPSDNLQVLHEKLFSELTTTELYELLKVRSQVFVVEQNCAYQDLDDDDYSSLHLWITQNNKIVAMARVCPAGTHMKEISIGRVITTERGKGYGKQIMQQAIKAAVNHFGAEQITIEAQEYAQGFYEAVGFRKTSDTFLLDGIPHIQMTWTAISRNNKN